MTADAVMAVRAEAQGASEPARRILFVCTGNTCRSPMAAALCNHLAGQGGKRHLTAASAGLYAAEGAPMTPLAAAALQRAGVAPIQGADYTLHRARNVTQEMIEQADAVVALTGAHAMELMLRFPDAASRIGTLPMDIPDPYGGSQEVYDACLASLWRCIELAFFTEAP